MLSDVLPIVPEQFPPVLSATIEFRRLMLPDERLIPTPVLWLTVAFVKVVVLPLTKIPAPSAAVLFVTVTFVTVEFWSSQSPPPWELPTALLLLTATRLRV